MQRIQASNSRNLRNQIVGRTIAGVVARVGRNGEPPTVMMLQFEDGSVLEFVSPRSDRVLRGALTAAAVSAPPPNQLALAVA